MIFDKVIRIDKGSRFKILFSGEDVHIYYTDNNSTNKITVTGSSVQKAGVFAYCDEAQPLGDKTLYRIRNTIIIKEE